MALQCNLIKDGITYENAYTRVETKIYKKDVVTQKYVPATYKQIEISPAVEYVEPIYGEDGEILIPAIDPVTAQYETVVDTPEVLEVIEWLLVLRVYSFTYSSKENSKNVRAIQEKNQGEVVYNGGEIQEEGYNYLKTLEEFKDAINV